MALQHICRLARSLGAAQLASHESPSQLLFHASAFVHDGDRRSRETTPAGGSGSGAAAPNPRRRIFDNLQRVVKEHRELKAAEAAKKGEEQPTWATERPDFAADGEVGALWDRETGYAALGRAEIAGVTPYTAPVRPDGRRQTRAAEALTSQMAAELDRIHPSQTFYQGRTYEPRDLNPFAKNALDRRARQARRQRRMDQSAPVFVDRQVREEADFRNLDMLRAFCTPFWSIRPRNRATTRAVTYRKVARAIKTARCMALVPFVGLHPTYEGRNELAAWEQRLQEADGGGRAAGAQSGRFPRGRNPP